MVSKVRSNPLIVCPQQTRVRTQHAAPGDEVRTQQQQTLAESSAEVRTIDIQLMAK